MESLTFMQQAELQGVFIWWISRLGTKLFKLALLLNLEGNISAFQSQIDQQSSCSSPPGSICAVRRAEWSHQHRSPCFVWWNHFTAKHKDLKMNCCLTGNVPKSKTELIMTRMYSFSLLLFFCFK